MRFLPNPVNEFKIKAIITEELPQFQVDYLQIQRSAWGRTTVEVNGEIILRFPLTPAHADELLRERAVLASLKGKTTLGIPTICFVGRTVAFDGYYKFPGEPLPPQRFSELSPEKQHQFATQLAQFFWEIHSAISVEEATQIGLKPISEDLDDAVTASLLRQRFLPLIEGKFQKQYAESVIELLETIQVTDSVRTLIHGDLHAYNLTGNLTEGKLISILDFENAAVDDFHWDFRYLLSWGHYCERSEILLETVLNEYTKLSGHQCSFRRCLIYSAVTDFYDLTWRIEQGYPIVGTISSRLTHSQKLMARLELFD